MGSDQSRAGRSRVAKRETDTRDMSTLIDDLTCKDVYKCRRARQALVDRGETAVPYLMDALDHRDGMVRWESAKALTQIPGPVATDALVTALGNDNFDVRWLAAEGLIPRGREGLAPLMRALIEDPDSAELREGAHHVLLDLSHSDLRETVLPVLQVLDDVDRIMEVPLSAKALLGQLEA